MPGLERLGGAHQLRPPCSQRGLTWLRHLVYRLARQGQVIIRREQRPDWRQPRGYDWMACLYPVERRDEDTAAYFFDHRRRRVVVVLHFNAWAARNLRAKGILSMEHILTRPMTPIEIEDESPRTRLHYLIYADWAGFFEDELAVGVPSAIVAQLRAFARNHLLANSVNQSCASDN